MLSPPEAMVRAAHLYPSLHPSRMQSQLGWDFAPLSSAPVSGRRLNGFSTPIGGDTARSPPEYHRALSSGERTVALAGGDVLYIPALVREAL